MRTDIFFSICQNEVDGHIPSEKTMWTNFFDQVRLADDLGFGTAWVAESHLSSEVQKRGPAPVIPQFKGEIGLNTDVLQLAHKVFSQTKRIHVGSAIRNILCNGGPMAHAELVKTFLSLHGLGNGLGGGESRKLDLGFASGRFPYVNAPYGIRPRNEVERIAWPVLKNLIFQEATEIFLRFIRGDVFASSEVTPKIVRASMFRQASEWEAVVQAWKSLGGAGSPDAIEIPSCWVFDQVGVIPFDAPLDLLRLTIGAHDAATQALANKFMPVGVFNLSITPTSVIEETHERMKKVFNPAGGEWTRHHMPRTVLVFIDDNATRAREQATKALSAYWTAMEGTLDIKKVEQAAENALIGTPDEIRVAMKERFHKDDRLMLWFDFNNHDNESVKRSMKMFMEQVQPHV